MANAQISLCAILVVLAGGCDALTDPNPIHLGVVTEVIAPESAAAGELFTITVITGGPNSCWRKERTEVDAGRSGAVTITPYDFNLRDEQRDVPCANEPARIEHWAALKFDQEGVREIQIRGRDGTDREITIVIE